MFQILFVFILIKNYYEGEYNLCYEKYVYFMKFNLWYFVICFIVIIKCNYFVIMLIINYNDNEFVGSFGLKEIYKLFRIKFLKIN